MRIVKRLALALLALSATGWSEAPGPVASDWFQGFNNKARLVAGMAVRDGEQGLYAGVAVAMPPGWKTYWRSPGDAGGVPPEFDWQGSENLVSARVFYPAPHRLPDKAGDAVGYKDSVVFPVLLTPKDKSKPVKLQAKVSYGVCKDICIPAEAELQISVPPDVGTSDALTDALKQVPSSRPRTGIDPELAEWRLDQTAGKPLLMLLVASAAPGAADVFVDAPGGIYLPLPKRRADVGGKVEFEVDLTDGVDVKDLRASR